MSNVTLNTVIDVFFFKSLPEKTFKIYLEFLWGKLPLKCMVKDT